MLETINIATKDFYSSSEDTQLLLLNFLKMNNKSEEIKKLIMNVPFLVKRQVESKEIVGIAHETIEFALNYFYDDLDVFSSILDKLESDLGTELLLKQSGYKYNKYESFAIDGQSSGHSIAAVIPGTIQNELYTNAVLNYVVDADEKSIKRFDLIKNNKYLFYATTSFGVSEKLTKLEALKFVSPSKDLGVMEIFLGLGRVEDARSVWDKNSQTAAYSRRLKTLCVEQFWAANQYGYNQASGCLSNISLNSLTHWLKNPYTMFFLTEQLAEQKLSLTNSIVFLNLLFSKKNSAFSEEKLEHFKGYENLSVGIQIVSMLYKRLVNRTVGEHLPGADLINENVLNFIVKNYDTFLNREFPDIKNESSSMAMAKMSGKKEVLKTIEYLLAHTPPDICKSLWEKTPKEVIAFSFGRGVSFRRDTLESLCSLEKIGISDDLLTDVLVVSAKTSLERFPSTFDASPFHMFISVASTNLLEKFLLKMKAFDPTVLHSLLNTECWTLLELNLRKKGDAFSVAVGLGDVEKTKILLKYSEEDLQAKSQINNTLKYLKTKGSVQHIKAMSAFESLLLEKSIAETQVIKEVVSDVKKVKQRL